MPVWIKNNVYCSLAEAARRLGFNDTSVRNWVKAMPDIPLRKIGNAHVVSVNRLKKELEKVGKYNTRKS